MDTHETQVQRNGMEQQLRISGRKLDMLWMQARNATGKERIDLHMQIGPLREKQRVEREKHEELKKAGTIRQSMEGLDAVPRS